MCGQINEILKSPLTWGGSPLYKDANFKLYWSHAQDQLPHFSAPISSFPGPKQPPFSLPICRCEHLRHQDAQFFFCWAQQGLLISSTFDSCWSSLDNILQYFVPLLLLHYNCHRRCSLLLLQNFPPYHGIIIVITVIVIFLLLFFSIVTIFVQLISLPTFLLYFPLFKCQNFKKGLLLFVFFMVAS